MPPASSSVSMMQSPPATHALSAPWLNKLYAGANSWFYIAEMLGMEAKIVQRVTADVRCAHLYKGRCDSHRGMAPIADLAGVTTVQHVVGHLCYRDTGESPTESTASAPTTVCK